MRKLNLVFMFLLFFTGTMTVLSCEDDETVTVTLETNIPEVHFEYDNYWAFVANGEYLTLDNLHINDSTSSEGIAIKQVDFYLDGELVSSSLVSPFSLRYLIQDRSVGEHQLTVVVQVTGGGYSDITCRFNLAVYVLEEPFALRAGLVFDNPPVDGVVHNGDILSGHVEVVENSIGATMARVEYYWDDKLFDAAGVSPFAFSYVIADEAAGEHELRFLVRFETPYGDMTSSGTATVTVVE